MPRPQPGRPEFDALADIYDAMINWTARLQRESPLLEDLVRGIPVTRALDAACGTGRHAELLASWGVQVEAADVSAAMLDRGKSRAGHCDSIRWVQRPYNESSETGHRFDLILCIGNSLALAADMETVQSTLRCLLGQLSPIGVLLIQVLNPGRFELGRCTWQKCQRLHLDGDERIVLKGIRRSADEAASVEFLLLDPVGPSIVHSRSTTLLPLDAGALARHLQAAGVSQLDLYGDYARSEFDPTTSPDVIAIARGR